MYDRKLAYINAVSFLGVTEHPLGSNRGPEIDEWNRKAGVPQGSKWCMSFIHSMYLPTGRILPGGASVGNFELWAVHAGLLVFRPFRYDIVCFEWASDSWPDHVGIVESVLAVRWRHGRFVGWLRTIEGNTDNATRRKWRWVNERTRFARIPG